MSPSPLIDRFHASAGAGYGVAALSAMLRPASQESVNGGTAFLCWLLVSEALVRNDNAEATWSWVDDQLELFALRHRPLANRLHRELGERWTSGLPVLIFGSSNAVPHLWRSFCDHFPAPDSQRRTLRKLLFHLIDRYGRELFTPGGWKANLPEDWRYTSPDRCAVVKLRLTLKALISQNEPDDVLLHEWRDSVTRRQILESLPARITRGFAPESPQFEDLLLAILQVAEWLSHPDSGRIADTLRDVQKRPLEAFTEDQGVFAGALLGWVSGYRTVAGWVQDAGQRRSLSEQALALAMADGEVGPQAYPGEAPRVFHLSPGGTYSAFAGRYLNLLHCRHEETRVITPTLAEAEAISRDTILCQAGSAFRLSCSF